VKSLKVFLPQIAAYQIEDLALFTGCHDEINFQPLKQDWQELFCLSVGFSNNDLPWTLLRLAQFNIKPSVKIACCCDPVMMQLTHRGAYMMGQSPLQLTQNDAIRIVAQINERLMGEGENLYLVDKHAWLFTSEKEYSLSSEKWQALIGKDMFNFSYSGIDASHWQRLNAEIQMLLKQMVDYQGLAKPPAETMMNIHFSDPISLNNKKPIPFINNDLVTVVSDNSLIKTFCSHTFLKRKNLQSINQVDSENSVVIAFDNEKENYIDILKYWMETRSTKKVKISQVVCQDGIFEFKHKSQKSRLSNLFDRLFGKQTS